VPSLALDDTLGLHLPAGFRAYKYPNLGEVEQIIPPAGWSPLAAPAKELSLLGFPEKPQGAANLTNWVAEMTAFRGFTAPGFCLSGNHYAFNQDSTIWSGAELQSFTRNTYFNASGLFTEPHFAAVCPHQSDHALWTGIGGDVDGDLIQTGTEVNMQDVNGPGFGWWEIISDSANFDSGGQTIPNWDVVAGHQIRASVKYESPTVSGLSTGRMTLTLEDTTNGISPPPVVIGSYKTHAAYEFIRGETAEFIAERAANDSLAYPAEGHLYYLRKPTSDIVWSAASAQGKSVYMDPNLTINKMYSDTYRTYLETASGIVTTVGGFYDYWQHCPGE